MTNTLKATTNTAGDIAKKAAQQAAHEPWEILRQALKQTGMPAGPASNEELFGIEGQVQENKQDIGAKKEISEEERQEAKKKDERLLSALEVELTEIRRQKLFAEIQRRIANGEEIAIENFPDLSWQQKEVLKAQIEALRERRVASEKQQQELVEPVSKRGRRLFGGMFGGVKKQQERVERPLPPSG